MREDDDQQLAEFYGEKEQFELALIQRIKSGLTTNDDALYVAWALGHTTNASGDKYEQV